MKKNTVLSNTYYRRVIHDGDEKLHLGKSSKTKDAVIGNLYDNSNTLSGRAEWVEVPEPKPRKIYVKKKDTFLQSLANDCLNMATDYLFREKIVPATYDLIDRTWDKISDHMHKKSKEKDLSKTKPESNNSVPENKPEKSYDNIVFFSPELNKQLKDFKNTLER